MAVKDTSFYSTFQMNARGILHTFDTPLVMGIINVTPDSFYADSRHESSTTILACAKQMLEDGATILDIGGYSSRPGAEDISVKEETARVVNAVSLIRKAFPEVLISVDSFRAEVVQAALNAGADMINDISAGQLDNQMFKTAAAFNAPYIMMHMRGTPQTMKDLTQYENLMMDLHKYFSERIQLARAAGVKDIIIDPGFGFSKTVAQNFTLLRNLEMFHLHELPVLIGISRKSMIYKTLDKSPDESLNGTTALNMFSLEKGASILRVHDVKEAMECIELHKAIHCAE